MSKGKRFRRVKVSNLGYVSGKRQQLFRAHTKSLPQRKKTPASAPNAGGGGVENENKVLLPPPMMPKIKEKIKYGSEDKGRI